MEKLKIPQIRVLNALDSIGKYSALTRSQLAERAGFSALSGTVTRVLNGLREGSSSGAAHPGLLSRGYISATEFEVDGVTDTLYRITDAGRKALDEVEGADLPDMRSRERSINHRYKKEQDND